MKCYDWSNKNLRVVEWVRCSERMPQPNKPVWILFEGTTYDAILIESSIGKKYWEGSWKLDTGWGLEPICFSVEQVEWWMYLPELPDVGEE